MVDWLRNCSVACCIVRLLAQARHCGQRTRHGWQKTLVGVCENLLTTASRLKAHLEAEPSGCCAPPGHRRLHSRLALPARVEMKASIPQSWRGLLLAAPRARWSAQKALRIQQHCPERDQQLARQRHQEGLLARATRAGDTLSVPD